MPAEILTLEPLYIPLLFGIGLLGGLIEATAGGSGLVTLPALLMLGLGPVQAMATSKFQYAFGAVASIARFMRAGLVDWRACIPLMLAGLAGGAAGALALTAIDPELVATLIPFLLIAAAAWFAFSPRFDDHERKQRFSILTVALLAVPPIAFYDGFFGTGSASFYVMAFVALLGLNARRATAMTKLVDFASGGAALVVLASGGHVLWLTGLLLAAGQVFGAWFGAGLVVKHGAKWVRPVIVAVTLALSLNLLAQHHDYILGLLGLTHEGPNVRLNSR
ncbi:MAG: TSUP family transporter [Alphaproteobacteria bacterium]|nr:TSUP family transporter [Alphaproteobacteria bacterium]